MKSFRLMCAYTVEASLLMPMILTVIVLVIYLTFFLHDRAILQSAAYTACLRGSQLINGEDVYVNVEKWGKELIKDRLIATGDVETQIEIKGDRITVAYDGALRIPAGTLLCKALNGGRDMIDVRAQSQADCVNPIGFIRKCRIVENILGSTGDDEKKE